MAGRSESTFGQNVCAVNLHIGHCTDSAVCSEGYGTAAAAAFFTITASVGTLGNIPKTFMAINTVQSFIDSAFSAQFTIFTIFVCTIGAKLTSLAEGIAAVKTSLTASAAVIAKVSCTIHAVITAVFADFCAVFADFAAVGADDSAVFTERTVITEFRTAGAYFTAVGTEMCTVFALSAGRA